MRLLPRRKALAALALSPDAPLRATETVTAAVTLEEPLDGVTRAVVELGYVNSYRYRWAGRNDAAFKHDDSSLVTMGQVGTDYGSEKETADWVHVLDEPLTFAGGRLEGGTHTVSLRLPSWSPGSSESTVAWQARLRIERDGRDVEAEAPLSVLVAAPDPPPAELPLIQGESAIANDLVFELETERACYRPGDEVRGVLRATPKNPIDRVASLGIYFIRLRHSHPLEKRPGSTTDIRTRPTVKAAEEVMFVQGETTELQFAATLPGDSDPTTEAVHSSVEWLLCAEVNFAGMTGGIERAKRGIVVHTA